MVGAAAVAQRNTAEGLMPWNAVQLKPGVDTQLSPAANQAGISRSQLIRFKEGLLQTNGGWQTYVGFSIGSTVRDLHPWQDINGIQRLAVGATQSLSVITAGSNTVITPQTRTSNPAPNFSVSSGSNLVTVVDPGSSLSTFDAVYFNTQLAVGTLLLSGAYPINSVIDSSSYTIKAAANSCITVAASGILPIFAISSGLSVVTVTLPNNGYTATTGLFQQFIPATSLAGQPIQGKYQLTSVIDSTTFTINAMAQSSATASSTMNGGLAQLVYYITLAPSLTGTGFGGSSGFGSGGFGTGTAQAGAPGTPITATDWTTDNWGEVLLSCPKDGPVYVWSPDFGFQNAQVITQAPFFNGGMFISMPQQILVCWKSVESTGVQDPLVVRWSNAVDYTNWTVSNQTTAGAFHIPTGSVIMGGIQCPQFGLISTDVDVWTQTYVGGTVIFNFTRVGSGCGWISSHACGILAGNPYWMGVNNFFTVGGQGVQPLPCTVWDQVFQNLNTAQQSKVRVAVNSAFNEVAWFYPSANATECDSYVRVHIEGQEFEWDYGSLSRTAWCDLSILGMPLGVDSTGQIYQHETGTAITGAGLPSFQTGWWAIGEAEELAYVDMIVPDFIWGTRAAAQNASINITFYVVNYPGDTPRAFGPYTVTQATQYISLRARGKLMSALIQSNASSEFWRLGRIRFRVARSGRR